MNSTYTEQFRYSGSRRATLARAVFKSILLLPGLVGIATQEAAATPLPDGTKLSLTAGSGSGVNTPCSSGSCFGMEVVAETVVWTNIEPGSDGGLILGKDQESGGQEIGTKTDGTGSLNNFTLSQISASWFFGGNRGTFFTKPGVTGSATTGSQTSDSGASLNVFDNAPCAGAACIDKTTLKTFHVAWNGQVITMGSFAGCTMGIPPCSSDQAAGIFITDYTINPVTGGAWSINQYTQIVPSSGFAGVPFSLILRGFVTEAPPTLALLSADKTSVTGSTTVTLTGKCTTTSPVTVSTCLISGPATVITQAATGTSFSQTRIETFTPTADGTYVFTLTTTPSSGAATTDNISIFVSSTKIENRSSTKSGCSLNQGAAVNPSERFDWWLVMGFIAWLGTLAHRHRRKQARA